MKFIISLKIQGRDKWKDSMKRTKKMHNPEDMFIKRSNAYLGRVMHNYHNLPGRYLNTRANQYPDGYGIEKKTDATILVDLELEKEESEKFENSYEVLVSKEEIENIPELKCVLSDAGKMIIDIEDESSKVDKHTLKKDLKYGDIIRYESGLPVYTVIITPLPLDSCETCYVSGSTIFKPKIISYDTMDGEAKLKEYWEKYERGEFFSDVEGYDLISIPRMYGEKGNEVIEEVCILFDKIKMKNGRVKKELARCLDCLINKYCETLEEINRLEELINMVVLINIEEEYEDRLREEGRAEGRVEGRAEGRVEGRAEGRVEGRAEGRVEGRVEGRAEGRVEGRIELARQFVKEFGAEKVSKISGIDKKCLL